MPQERQVRLICTKQPVSFRLQLFLFQGWNAVEPGADAFSAQRQVLEHAEEETGESFGHFKVSQILLLPDKRRIQFNSVARGGRKRKGGEEKSRAG